MERFSIRIKWADGDDTESSATFFLKQTGLDDLGTMNEMVDVMNAKETLEKTRVYYLYDALTNGPKPFFIPG